MPNCKDGPPTSDRYSDVYLSTDPGLGEVRHVFLQGNHLAERFLALSAGESLCIGETGFGIGLNFLCAWQLFEQVAPVGASLDFFSVEKLPLDDDELRVALALWPELAMQAEALLARWRRRVPGWNRWSFASGRVRLTLAMEDVARALPQLPQASVDAWFIDSSSPAKNTGMRCEEALSGIAHASRAGATLATNASAAWVRHGLQQAGFAVEYASRFWGECEMTCGQLRSVKPVVPPKQGKTPRTALVIGGGIAGCAAAHALAQRGIAVTLIERAAQLATAGSGNPRGILHARFGAGDNPLHRFVLASYGHALALLDEAVPADGVMRSECGLLQLACNEVEIKRIARLAELEWPEHLMQFVDAAQATQLAGVEMSYGGLWFPSAGWVVPPKICAALADDARITQLLEHEVTGLEMAEAGWRASGHDAQGRAWDAVAEVVLVCCAHAAKKIAQFAQFPLISVRGQITIVPETAGSHALQSVVCGDGYCAPAVAGVHVTGATHAFNDEAIEVRTADHAENLANLAEYAPALRQMLGEAESLNGRASVRCSAPGSTPLAGRVQEGLYCSLAHGTRGLLTAGLAGEVLAAQICGQLPPLPVSIIAALSPLPRTGNKGKCAA
ncbi:MAG: bifunctional tRNA (5-methylaminomethyl-2-thiouridine)(34)-methyltransferase MnmD/FAD-dependent 5-carboxymethylaminomethyl-2-thiouridine(34) oxidoreductase MnmC [Nitrosomonadales bacterium]|nr:bifunctional tRNA (5-methylaminomethyl-2-thiouridine)(34)-methyltransferase MnmD/FAD-dependent 5-carboxymethylaminomethyl-2-thiouridine(34) oxidoreductase MnmC [Nitrosomonadales bacterium]